MCEALKSNIDLQVLVYAAQISCLAFTPWKYLGPIPLLIIRAEHNTVFPPVSKGFIFLKPLSALYPFKLFLHS